MADMYSLPAYMNSTVKLKTVEGIYALPNYHNSTNKETEGEPIGHFTVFDPIICLEKKQERLISALTELGNKLNITLKCKGREINRQKETANDKKEVASSDDVEIVSKKDKNVKKEVRKNAKQDAKAKIASETRRETRSDTVRDPNNSRWTIKVSSALVKDQSLEPCNKPELAKYIAQELGNIEMTITNKDVPWVAALSLIGSRRRVAFPGKVGNNIKPSGVNASVLVTIGDSFSATMNGICVRSRVATWKVLGSSLGIFSFDPLLALQAAHQHQWLVKAERVLEQQLDMSLVVREMSQYLSRFDTLGSHFDIGIADIIFRSLLLNENSYANNVELWASRVDTAV